MPPLKRAATIATTTIGPLEVLKPWQRGWPLTLLKEIRATFAAFDAGLTFGAFTPAKENTIADWLAKGQLRQAPGAAIVVAQQKAKRTIEGFAGPIGCPAIRACLVKRIACLLGAEGALLGLLQDAAAGAPELWLETWREHPLAAVLTDALGLRWAGSKVLASSEIVGVWAPAAARVTVPSWQEQAALERLDLRIPAAMIARALAVITREAPKWEQHYSGYNKRGTWTALALRGFGGQSGFIIKPAEMAKKWKEEHPIEMGWACVDTPLMTALREVAAISKLVPGAKERVRLMRLAPGGGELSRHADITDLDAGIATGKLLRIHIPLATNPQVVFRQWLLDGQQKDAHMVCGEAWYLDTRKPHTARNGGSSERVHLVMDCVSCPELLALLPKGGA